MPYVPRVGLDFCTVASNRAGDGGGIALSGQGAQDGFALTVSRSTLAHNQARRGGGLFIGEQVDLPVAVDESTIADNSAVFGGGVYNPSDTLWLLDCTVSGNLASSLLGGGLYTIPDQSDSAVLGDTVLKNTIVAGNKAPLFSFFLESDVAGPIDSLGHNLFGERVPNGSFVRLHAPDPTDLLGVDARLGPLKDNGGPTQTMALLDGSPAIGAGTLQSDPTTGDVPRADQRGAPVVSFTDVEGNVVTPEDIGAFGASNGPVPTHTPAGTCDDGATTVDTGGQTPSFPPAGAGKPLAPPSKGSHRSGLGGIEGHPGGAIQGVDVSSLVPTAHDEVWLVPLPARPFAPPSRPLGDGPVGVPHTPGKSLALAPVHGVGDFHKAGHKAADEPLGRPHEPGFFERS
jgi:hypothetical protein